MSALRSFYNYYYKHQIITKNPVLLVDMPKLHERRLSGLDADEVALLLDFVESAGSKLTGQALVYYKKTRDRDLAILTLLLGTGIRVSECVGLDLRDVDFKNNGITVTRKGGNQMVVYFGEEVASALQNYINGDRKMITPLSGHENALFLSTQKKRMGVQAVENMVKKYAKQVTPYKKITPHKLRSTYGTSLYKETGDIYLVADVLGHKDVNTTKKHYAAIDEDRRRQAASAVKLRKAKEVTGKDSHIMKLQQLLSYTRKAVDEYQMIEEGDHIAVGISGGKDSLTLLYALHGLKRFYPNHFELSAVTVDLGYEACDFSPVVELCKELDVPYHIVKTDIAHILFEDRKEPNPCSLCAKMRKGALNQEVKKMGVIRWRMRITRMIL